MAHSALPAAPPGLSPQPPPPLPPPAAGCGACRVFSKTRLVGVHGACRSATTSLLGTSPSIHSHPIPKTQFPAPPHLSIPPPPFAPPLSPFPCRHISSVPPLVLSHVQFSLTHLNPNPFFTHYLPVPIQPLPPNLTLCSGPPQAQVVCLQLSHPDSEGLKARVSLTPLTVELRRQTGGREGQKSVIQVTRLAAELHRTDMG